MRLRRHDCHSKRFHSDGSERRPSLEAIADVGNLLHVFRELKFKAGQAPGVDRITYRDVGDGEAVTILRDVSDSILAGAYRPDPLRRVTIPKADGGKRTLRLPTIRDRVVAAAVRKAIEPAFEAIFEENSHGFRPGRSAWTLLALLDVMMITRGQYVLVNDDVRGAFDHVIIATLSTQLCRVITDPDVMTLTEIILRGHERKEIGIPQGNPLSPLALNVLLHYAHDLTIGGHHPLWWRFADNLGAVSQSVPEGHQLRSHAQRAVNQVGLTLKGAADPDSCVINLMERKASLLGYITSIRSGAMTYEMAPEAWVELEENLLLAHRDANPPKTANAVIRGWVEWCGPAFENRRTDFPGRVYTLAKRLGFRETDCPEAIGEQWEDSWLRWQKCREAAWLSPIVE
jgi:hypothetical protein